MKKNNLCPIIPEGNIVTLPSVESKVYVFHVFVIAFSCSCTNGKEHVIVCNFISTTHFFRNAMVRQWSNNSIKRYIKITRVKHLTEQSGEGVKKKPKRKPQPKTVTFFILSWGWTLSLNFYLNWGSPVTMLLFFNLSQDISLIWTRWSIKNTLC